MVIGSGRRQKAYLKLKEGVHIKFGSVSLTVTYFMSLCIFIEMLFLLREVMLTDRACLLQKKTLSLFVSYNIDKYLQYIREFDVARRL